MSHSHLWLPKLPGVRYLAALHFISSDFDIIPSDIMHKDPLTGVNSRAGLQDSLQVALAQAAEEKADLSLLVLDIDYLKSINDAFGHRRGDEVLVEFAERLRALTRSTDLLFRTGGDEFLVVLPHTGKPEGAEIAARLLEGVKSPQFGGEPPLAVSLSIGLATFPAEAGDADKLIERADLRAYEAKRGGRGRVVSEDQPLAGRAFGEDTSSRLVERDHALEQLRRWMDKSRQEKGAVLAIAGPEGSGRSRFLDEAAKLARLRGYAVITRGQITELSLDEAAPQHFADAVEQLVAGEREGVLFAIDDLPSLPDESMEAMHRLFEEQGIGQVALVYSGDRSASQSLLPPNAPVETIYIQGLSPQGLRVWLRSLLQWECPATFIEWLYKETGGLPGYVRRGLEHLVERGALVQRDGAWVLQTDVATISLREELGLKISAPPNNLPAVPYSFVGRHRETEEIRRLLRVGRLVTLTGPGGIGKTHLAVHTASVLLDQFEDGVFFVPLADILDAEQVASTLAQTLGITQTGGKSPLDDVKARLRDKDLLLVMDNFEQVMEAASLVAEVLAGCPSVKVIATSREALRVRGEQVFDLQPLAVPGSDVLGRRQSADDLAGYPAIAMFVQSARSARPDFALTDENASTIASICARVDGLPLAIELVAARVKLLTPGEMLARLKGPGDNEALRLLTGGPRDMPDRHRTMHSAIGWSYDLLSDAEKKLFSWLGVFAGGFTLDAAEKVAGNYESDMAHYPHPDAKPAIRDAPSESVLDLVSSLLDKSLVKRVSDEGGGEARFAMLETIRDYALEMLAASGQAPHAGKMHAAYYRALAERAEPFLVGPEQKQWLALLAREYSNMRASLAWALEAGHWELLAQMAILLWRLWYLQGPVNEGRTWLGHALARRDAISPPMQARVLQGAGVLARSQGDATEAKALLEEGLALWREMGDKQGISNALNSLGLLAIEQGLYDEAQPYLEESALLDRERGDKQRLSVSLNNLGGVAFYRGDYLEARRFYTESLELRREMGDKWGIANSIYNLGEVAQHEGEYERSGDLYKESLVLRHEVGDRRGICICLDGVAAVAMHTEQYMLSAILISAADALRDATSAPRTAAAQADYERISSRVRMELGEEEYSRAWESGRMMGFEEALTLALSA